MTSQQAFVPLPTFQRQPLAPRKQSLAETVRPRTPRNAFLILLREGGKKKSPAANGAPIHLSQRRPGQRALSNTGWRFSSHISPPKCNSNDCANPGGQPGARARQHVRRRAETAWRGGAMRARLQHPGPSDPVCSSRKKRKGRKFFLMQADREKKKAMFEPQNTNAASLPMHDPIPPSLPPAAEHPEPHPEPAARARAVSLTRIPRQRSTENPPQPFSLWHVIDGRLKKSHRLGPTLPSLPPRHQYHSSRDRPLA